MGACKGSEPGKPGKADDDGDDVPVASPKKRNWAAGVLPKGKKARGIDEPVEGEEDDGTEAVPKAQQRQQRLGASFAGIVPGKLAETSAKEKKDTQEKKDTKEKR